jgi:hypothetical protein
MSPAKQMKDAAVRQRRSLHRCDDSLHRHCGAARRWRAFGKTTERPLSLLRTYVLALVLASFFLACKSSGAPDDDRLSVGGTYLTQVSLTENTCPNTTVQSLPTVVTHSAGSNALTLQHGPLTYTGSVSQSGAFTTTPNVIQDPPAGTQTTLTIAGQFSETGFIADVTVTVLKNTPPNCAYKVHWVGTKQGSANTIP